MAKYTHDVIIIGGGAGGLVATVGCSRLGLKTAVVEKHAQLGGDCLFHGCVPSKTLLKSASVYYHARSFPEYGLPLLQLPKVDLGKVNARVQSVIEKISEHDSPKRFEDMGADVFVSSAANFVSEHEVKVGTRTLSAPKIIVATGSGPISLPIEGIQEVGYITNLDIFSLQELPEELIVIGAGPIGVEMSQAFSRLGSKVSLIDIAKHILIKDDPDMSDIVRDEIVRGGINCICNAKILRAQREKNGKRVIVYERDGKTSTITGDLILIGAGRKGNAESLQCEQVGIDLHRGFIKVNDKLQSSQKHIYAIGDSNGKFLFTHIAAAEASVVIRRVALRAGGVMNYRAVPWVTYTDPEIASIGHNEQSARVTGIEYRTIVRAFDTNDRALAEGASIGKIKILIDGAQKVIGIQIVALHAGDLILPAIFAVQQRWKASAFISPIYPYPTMGDIYKGAVGEFMAPKLFNDKVRTILRILHRYRGKRTA